MLRSKYFSSIKSGALLKGEPEDSDIEIQLIDRSVVTRHGNKLASRPIELKKEPDGFFDKIFRIVQEQPQEFVTTMARGADSLNDAIAVSNAGSIDLSDVFSEMKPGQYSFKLTEKNGRSDNPASKTFSANVAKGAKVLFTAPDIAPGLYEMKTIEVVDEQERPVQKCWVAIVKKDNASDAQKKWQEALEKTKNWKDRPNACSRTCFLKAVLFSVARANAPQS